MAETKKTPEYIHLCVYPGCEPDRGTRYIYIGKLYQILFVNWMPNTVQETDKEHYGGPSNNVHKHLLRHYNRASSCDHKSVAGAKKVDRNFEGFLSQFTKKVPMVITSNL